MALKTSTSTSRNFSNIIFLDTPGLADGNLRYKFDVEGSFEWFARKSDLILVFLDPQGQALCKRTMKIVKELYDQQQNENKVHFVMTKGDVFETDDDRLKCMCQITQSLATVLPPMHGFAMPIISLPNKQGRSGGSINQIEDIVQLINTKQHAKAQRILTNFQSDIESVS